MDLLGETPIFDLRNPAWPILSGLYDGPMASFVRSRVDESMVGQGTQCIDARLHRSIVGRGVHIESGAELEECVILDGVSIGRGARLRRVIADRATVIPASSRIGFNRDDDSKRFHVSPSGLILLARGAWQDQALRQAS
jgi:glucose-1-phosphate adenylyltransferase